MDFSLSSSHSTPATLHGSQDTKIDTTVLWKFTLWWESVAHVAIQCDRGRVEDQDAVGVLGAVACQESLSGEFTPIETLEV